MTKKNQRTNKCIFGRCTLKCTVYQHVTIFITTIIGNCHSNFCEGRPGSGRDRMVVGFTTPYAISAYQH